LYIKFSWGTKLQQITEDIDGGRFTSPVGADQTIYFSGRNLQAEVVEYLALAVSFTQMVNF
jgi:hypothetical protein